MWQVEFYKTEAGRVPVLEWIEEMLEEDRGLALGYIEQLRILGTSARMPLVKPLGNKLYELRWPSSNKQHRIIYFAAPGRKFVMLNGFIKKRRETPSKEIATALRRMRYYNQRAEGYARTGKEKKVASVREHTPSTHRNERGRVTVNYEEVKNRLLADSKVREAYENPPLALATARTVVERRKALGMTQGQLAEAMGTSQSQVWRIESGHFNPTAKTLTRLESALDMSFGHRFRDFPRVLKDSPREQLEEWRNTGILVMSDDDFEHLLELKETDPGHLSKLVRIIENIEFGEANDIQVTVKLERAEPGEGEGSAKGGPKLELWATI